MGITLFIIGAMGFLLCFLFLFNMWEEELAPIIMYILAFLTLYFYSYGDSVFDVVPHKWILFSAAGIILVVYAINTIWNCIDFEPEAWMLWYILPASLEIVFVIKTFVDIDLSWLSIFQKISNYVFLCAIAFGFLLSIFALGIYYAKKKLKVEYNDNDLLEDSIRNANVDIWNANVAAIRLSGIPKNRLSEIISSVYEYLLREKESVRIHGYHGNNSYVFIGIREYIKDLPSPAMELLEERLRFDNLYKRSLEISLMEFTQLLVPELYRQTGDYTSSVKERLLEDLPNQITERVLREIRNKENVPQNNKLFQTQIRELFHSLMTPVTTINNAITILNISKNDSDFHITLSENLGSISNSISHIKALLYAYRGLALLDFHTEDCGITIKSFVFETVKSLNAQHGKHVSIQMEGLFNPIEGFSTELVVALILPLLQNAVEASPNDGIISIYETNIDSKLKISIENISHNFVTIDDLQRDGFSTKKNENKDHEGIGLPAVRHIAKELQIHFDINFNGQNFIATLSFPNRIKKEDM